MKETSKMTIEKGEHEIGVHANPEKAGKSMTCNKICISSSNKTCSKIN
jgi:hypothetical protein